jgi:hypothetical protein
VRLQRLAGAAVTLIGSELAVGIDLVLKAL